MNLTILSNNQEWKIANNCATAFKCKTFTTLMKARLELLERERPCRYDFLAFRIGLLKQNLCLMFPQKQQGDFYGTCYKKKRFLIKEK